MANNGTTKNVKELLRVNAQLGRNQVIQHCLKILLCSNAFDKKPTKAEFNEYFWTNAELLISDLSNWIEMGEEQKKKTVRKKIIKRVTKKQELSDLL